MKLKANLTFLLLIIISTNLFAFKKHSHVDYDSFKLLKNNSGYYLTYKNDNTIRKYDIPNEWLTTKKSIHKKLEKHVSLDKFMVQVTAFHITSAQELIGLHLSSYDIHDFGGRTPIGAAGGRDVFLIFDRKKGKLYRGNLDLGITKMRIKYGRCFSGKYTRFIIQYLPLDNKNDIGVITEEIKCTQYTKGKKTFLEGPRYYSVSPIKWYTFRGKDQGWQYSNKTIKNIPLDGFLDVGGIISLPNLCLEQTTIEFIKRIKNSQIISDNIKKTCRQK